MGLLSLSLSLSPLCRADCFPMICLCRLSFPLPCETKFGCGKPTEVFFMLYSTQSRLFSFSVDFRFLWRYPTTFGERYWKWSGSQHFRWCCLQSSYKPMGCPQRKWVQFVKSRIKVKIWLDHQLYLLVILKVDVSPPDSNYKCRVRFTAVPSVSRLCRNIFPQVSVQRFWEKWKHILFLEVKFRTVR